MIRYVWLVAALLIACRAAGPASQPASSLAPSAEREASVRPGINQPYFDDRDIPKWEGRFETESREIYRERERIVADIGIRSGDVVADIGAGTGLFTVLFAKAVGPTGKVIAGDIIPEFLTHIEQRVRDEGLRNVETVLGKEDSAELPPGCADVIFICDTYHHFEYPQSMLRSIRRALRPGGRLVIIDFERIEGVSSDWVLGHVRAGKERVIEELRAGGFDLAPSQPDASFLKENYLLVFVARP